MTEGHTGRDRRQAQQGGQRGSCRSQDEGAARRLGCGVAYGLAPTSLIGRLGSSTCRLSIAACHCSRRRVWRSCFCVVDGNCDVVQRIDSVLCQSLSDQVSHGCCTKWLPKCRFVPSTIGNFQHIGEGPYLRIFTKFAEGVEAQRFDLRFLRPLRADLSIKKSSSLAAQSALTIRRGPISGSYRLPRRPPREGLWAGRAIHSRAVHSRVQWAVVIAGRGFRKLYLADPGKSDPRTRQGSDGAHPQDFRVAELPQPNLRLA